MNVLELSEQEIIRRNSMNELRAMGIEPYPAAEYVTNAFSTDIKTEFKDDAEPRQVSVAGRIMSRRIMGKASFIELQDSKGRIQVYITRDDICPDENKEMYNTVFKRLLDLGDFIGIEGFVFRTQMGEISIHAKKLTVLAKSIKPATRKWRPRFFNLSPVEQAPAPSSPTTTHWTWTSTCASLPNCI